MRPVPSHEPNGGESTMEEAPNEVRPAGDPQCLATLKARYGDLIARYVHRRTDCPQEAARVVDAVFRTAASQRDTLPSTPLPWLIATARHECARALTGGSHAVRSLRR